MASQRFFAALALVVILSLSLNSNTTEGRYLPTRGNSDRLDKLRELLKEVSKMFKLLENEIEKEEYQGDAAPRWHPDRKLFYKREVPAQ